MPFPSIRLFNRGRGPAGVFSCSNDACGQLEEKKLVPVPPIYQFDWLIKNIVLTSAVLSTSDIM